MRERHVVAYEHNLDAVLTPDPFNERIPVPLQLVRNRLRQDRSVTRQ